MKLTKRHDPLLNETLLHKKLECGLEVFFIHKPGYQKKFAYFATKYGALYNQFIDSETHEKIEMPLGIAHFLEHKIFESSDKNIFAEFSKYGASVNAYTNFQATAYMFSTVEHFYPCLELLLDFVQTPHITDENVEKEKGIIAQEIKMYDDEPEWVGYFSLLKSMYEKHPVRYDIAGTVESIQEITTEQLMQCYRTFYAPDNMAVFVIGDLDEQQVFETVEKSLKPEYLARKKNVVIEIPEEPETIPVEYIENEFPISMPIFNLGLKDIDYGEDARERLKKSLAMKIGLDIAFGKSSSFFMKHYESGVINSSFSYEYAYGRTYSYTIFGGESLKYEEAMQYVLEEIESRKQAGFASVDVEKMVKKLIGRHISSYNAMQSISNLFISYYTKEAELFDYLDVLNEITPDYVSLKFNESLMTNRKSVSLIKPLTNRLVSEGA